jgi:PAS domain S-box-containing protein
MLTFYEKTFRRNRDVIALERSEKKYRKLVELSGILVFILDREFTIRFASDCLLEVLHRNPDEVTGKSFFEAFDVPEEGSLALLLEELASLAPYTTHQLEVTLAPPAQGSGKACLFDLLVTHMLDDPEINGFVLYLHDATRRKQAEEELQCINDKVDGFLYQTSSNLQEALLNLLGLLDIAPRTCPPEIPAYLNCLTLIVQQLERIVADLAVPAHHSSGKAHQVNGELPGFKQESRKALFLSPPPTRL